MVRWWSALVSTPSRSVVVVEVQGNTRLSAHGAPGVRASFDAFITAHARRVRAVEEVRWRSCFVIEARKEVAVIFHADRAAVLRPRELL